MPLVHALHGEKDWLVERMQALEYRADPVGIRFAIAYMAGQACLGGELKAFNQRIKFLQSIPVAELPGKIEKTNQTIARLTTEARMEALRELKEVRVQQNQVGTLKATLTKAQKKNLVSVVGEKVKEKLAKLTREQKNILDIQPFLDGVELYHQAYLFPHLFAKNMNPAGQQLSSFLPLLMSVKAKKQGEIAQAEKFSGIYKKSQLLDLFKSLREIFEKMDFPTVMIIGGMFHTLAVTFEPQSHLWTLVNASELPAQTFKKDEDLIRKIAAAFSESPVITLSIEIYVLKGHKKAIKEPLTKWRKSAISKELHRITDFTTLESDISGTSWLWMAARQGQYALVHALLKAGANPNQVRIDDVGPLYVAVMYGHEQIIEVLIEAGADPGHANSAGVSPLLMAGRQHDVEIIKVLLGDLNRKKK